MIDRRKRKTDLSVNVMKFIDEIENKGYVVTLIKQNQSTTKLNIKIEKGFVIENFTYENGIITPVEYANGLFAQYVENARFFNTARKRHGLRDEAVK